ncbi:hypothetical protein JIN85_18825 [Luteolibacter pohnpeiensis]|uniref:CARDB domain-containing protein n=2 Tax=Luteolibacter pohnpeiensis TaxID=454153 RepID=A0A934S984_9BACT|nr:hypothetical protein [Luteolibacter pohnpeiensis]
MGALLWEVFLTDSKTADLTISLGNPTTLNGNTRIPVFLRNLGKKSAENIQIEVLAEPDQKSELTIDFIARGSKAEATAVFHGTIPRNAMSAQITGYQND